MFQRVIEAWVSGDLHVVLPDPEACESFSAEKQVNALVRALKGQIAEPPFISDAVKVPLSLQGELGK